MHATLTIYAINILELQWIIYLVISGRFSVPKMLSQESRAWIMWPHIERQSIDTVTNNHDIYPHMYWWRQKLN
jgi:hypothetical protein